LLKHVRVVDAGSTDLTLNLIQGWNFPHLELLTLLNQDSMPRTPQWYKTVLAGLETKYFLFGNTGHVYSLTLLKELDNICSDSTVDAVYIPNWHTYSGVLDSSFGTYLPRFSLASLAAHLHKRRKFKSGSLLHLGVIDWSKYRLHQELPLRSFPAVRLMIAKNHISSFRDETSESIERKHATYATIHAKDLLGKRSSKLPSQFDFLLAYFGHFFHAWLYRGSCMQGVRGFITAHYWASYHTSLKIRQWEGIQGLTLDVINERHNEIKQQLAQL